MTDKIKVLVCGDVVGHFNVLFKKIELIQKKSGPFDLLICVGNFFGPKSDEFDRYKNGELKVPISTVILGANSLEHVALFSEKFIELCENVQYLGKRGMYISTHGLKIAYLSGVATNNATKENYEYNDEEVIALRDICLRGSSNFRGVDILLTSQWPSNINNGDPNWNTDVCLRSTSYHCAWLATQLKPRYHISGLEGVFFERAPFRVPSEDLEIATRFLALAGVGNNDKYKWIYALNLTPIDKMIVSELSQKTTDETVCPYDITDLDFKVLKKRKLEKQQYFYDMHAQQDKAQKKHSKKTKIEFDQSKCWFCLSSPTVEKHLIITVGDSVYLALAKGGLVDEHFLICPIQHYQCSINQSDEIQREVDRFKMSLTRFYKRNNNVPVFFERNYKTSHMQIQAVPIPKNAVKELADILKDEGEAQGIQLLEMAKNVRNNQVLPANVPYFIIEIPNGKILYTQIDGKKGFPLNFARQVLAMDCILNKSDKVDWRDCILSKEAEVELVEKLRGVYEPFDKSND